ncbi:MAG: hypothetical protein OXD50_08520 [Chloroflexi bacterium]|nr:hypothetical protein [Chloroflexota bacterium]
MTTLMHDPQHAGEAVLKLRLEPFDLSVANANAHLEVDAASLAELSESCERIIADLEVRLAQAFGGTADDRTRVQAACVHAKTRLKSDHIQERHIGSAACSLARKAGRLRHPAPGTAV